MSSVVCESAISIACAPSESMPQPTSEMASSVLLNLSTPASSRADATERRLLERSSFVAPSSTSKASQRTLARQHAQLGSRRKSPMSRSASSEMPQPRTLMYLSVVLRLIARERLCWLITLLLSSSDVSVQTSFAESSWCITRAVSSAGRCCSAR